MAASATSRTPKTTAGKKAPRTAKTSRAAKASAGARVPLVCPRVFSTAGVDPYDEVSWSRRDVVQTDWRTGAEVFAQRGVEFPIGWSENAATIVTTKYFRGALGTPAREVSLRQVIDRVVGVYASAAAEHNYFASDDDVQVFADELRWLLLHQVFSFNSPVWFNVGTSAPQTVSACFILHVEDSLKSILNWYSEEGTIFQAGSGAGVNLSAVRSSKELLRSSGGQASGPVSFMRGADASAGTIKSGGACLAPWTQVFTASGPRRVAELASEGEDFVVFAYNPALGRVQACPARAWLAGHKQLVQVVTDRGAYSVSVDHPMLLASGGYVPAGDLEVGARLRPAHVVADASGFRSIASSDGDGGAELLHRLVASDVLGADVDGVDVFHFDHDPANNVPENVKVGGPRLEGWAPRPSAAVQPDQTVVSVRLLDTSEVFDVEVDNDTPRDKSAADGHNFMVVSERDAEPTSWSGVFVANTRRAAKMVVLDVDHPDIVEFIDTKVHEEGKIRVLRDAGYDMELGGHDSTSVQYQNANNSVRVSDEFMRAVADGSSFGLRARLTGEVVQTVDAAALFDRMCSAAWECADPGVQYSDTISAWHTLANTGPITASNPCFTGDTLVAVADGRNAVRLDELAAAGTPVDVYSRAASGATVIRPMSRIRLTRRDADLVKVTLDDDTSVRCTPDHLFMLRDGSYRAASELCAGDSLARFDSEIAHVGGPTGSTRRRVSSARGWKPQYRAIGEYKFGNYRDGRGGFHLDHIDGDSLNDAPSNLQVLTAEEHTHKTNVENMLGDRNPARRMMNDQWRANISKSQTGEGNPRWLDVSDDELAAVYFAAVVGDPRAEHRKGHVAWNAYVRAHGLVGQVPLATGAGRIRGKSWDEFAEQMGHLAPVNHKVVSVVADGRADVYDGEVADTHNFAIITTVDADPRTGSLSGVFVHNCSEYMSIDNSSCNLASLNLMKFRTADGGFDTARFVAAVELVITAMDISICFADFPTEAIGDNTRRFRQLGIGYANLGALLMASGLPYDSKEGRAYAAAITALMTGVAYRRSAQMAAAVGPYDGYADNAGPHTAVMGRHAAAAGQLAVLTDVEAPVVAAARAEWAQCLADGATFGWRNAQASVLAPTGTIGFMMDCDTTGIEPDFSLVKYKKLVGGSSMQIVNQTIAQALDTLGYTTDVADQVAAHILEHGNVVDAPGLAPNHYAVFDTATGARPISAMGHVLMMAAVQPFLSGAISKTVNLPESATVEDVAEIYMAGWRNGLKALAIYRDNCKVGQPLSDGKAAAAAPTEAEEAVASPVRRRLPGTRTSRTYKFSISGVSGYLTTGEYDDGTLGELFVRVSKQGSTLSGIMDGLAMSVSVGLQYGVPLETFVAKYVNSSFEPAGMTVDPDVRMASSLLDWMFRRLAIDYLPVDVRQAFGIYTISERTAALDGPAPAAPSAATLPQNVEVEKPICLTCGVSTYMQRSGSCWACRGCGSTTGCS